MTRVQRRAHRWIWIAMGPALAVGLAAALMARGPRPAPQQGVPASAGTESRR